MAETLISLDQSKQPARADSPVAKPANNPELRKLAYLAVGIVFLVALILLIWIVISLFSSRFSIDSLPIVGSGGKVKDLSL